MNIEDHSEEAKELRDVWLTQIVHHVNVASKLLHLFLGHANLLEKEVINKIIFLLEEF